MTITESTLKIKNNRPRILYQDIIFKCDTLDSTYINLIENSCIKTEVDLKNFIVTMHIVEFNIDNFFNVLNNLFASLNISLLISRKEPTYSTNTKTYTPIFPLYKFTLGKVQEHKIISDLRNDGEQIHIIKIKFNKFVTSTNINETL